MKKMNQFYKHYNNKDLKSIILLNRWEEITHYRSCLHDKINQGEFVEFPDRLPKKMLTSEVTQELQILKQKAFGKNLFYQPVIQVYKF